MKYTTVQGDTWDKIAYMHYGNELMAEILMKENIEHIETFVFGSGTVLEIPDIEEEKLDPEVPPWR